MKNERSAYAVILLLFVVGICYFGALGSSFVWDDYNVIGKNAQLTWQEEVSGIFLTSSAGFYRPLSSLTIWLDYLLWGRNPFGFHLTNVVFHSLSAVLFFYLVRQLTGSFFISLASSLLFAVHPVHSEAVSYISGRSDLITVFFILSSFSLYLRSLAKNKKAYLFLSLGLFALSLFSREVSLIYPSLIFGYNLFFIKINFRKKIKLTLPFVIAGFIYLIFRYFFVEGYMILPKLGEPLDIFRIFLFYSGLLLFPFNLHMHHSLEENLLLYKMPFLLSFLIFLGFLFFILKLKKKNYCYLGLYWFILGILPFLILKFNSYAEIAEHWLYLPSLGSFLLGGIIMSKINKSKLKFLIPGFVLILITLTIRQNATWRNDLTLYTYTLHFQPKSFILHYNLGNAYLRRNMLNEAEREYRLALELKPDYSYALNNLGIVLERRGRLGSAYQLYKRANYRSAGEPYTRKNLLRFQFIPSAFAQDEITFDHTLYGKVLSGYVKNGGVNYKELKKNPYLLYGYLMKVAHLQPDALDSMPRNEKIAFYINVYNAATLKAIIEHYPLTSIKKIPGVWDKLKFVVAGREITLNDLEHKILRPQFKDPRIHFTLVCAARGCPQLRAKPYSGDNLDAILDEEGYRFLNNKSRNRLDKEKNILYLSSIFKWFKQDFGDVIGFISSYLSKDKAAFIKQRKPRIKYQYDWSLNEKGG